MKKQFLLGLMAMLLPLAAWAQEKIDIKDATVVFEYAVYAGTATEAPDVESVTVNGAKLASSDYSVTYYTDDEYSNPVEKTAFRHAGTYYAKITATSDSYTGEKEVSFDIDKAELTLTVGNTSKVYGETDDELPVVYGANYQPGDSKTNVKINGLKVERVKGFEGEDVGSYTITLNDNNATIEGAWANDYDLIVTSQGSLTINPKALTLNYSGLSDWIYGQAEEKLEGITVTGGSNYAYEDTDDTVGLVWAINGGKENVKDAKEYTITASITSKNYTLENPTETFNIAKADLHMSVTSVEKTYGEEDPAISATSEDWQYNDKETVKVTLVREEGENVKEGGYKINSCTIDSENYNVIYDEESQATLTIKPKNLSANDIKIEVEEADKVYQGQAEDFSLENIKVTYEGAKTIDNKTLTADTDYTFTITENVKDAGEAVTVTVKAVDNGNYTGENNTYTFDIAKAELSITIEDQTIDFNATKTAEEQLDKDKYTISGLKSGDNKEDLGIVLYLDEDAAKGSVGSYNGSILFKAEGKIAGNYNITPATEEGKNGNLKIIGENAITLDGAVTGSEISNTVAAYDGQTNVNVTIKNLKSLRDSGFKNGGQWYTLVLPFDVTVREISNAFGYAVVDVPTETNNDPDIVAFHLTMGTVPANTLMIFKVDNTLNSDEDVNLANGVTFESKTIVAPTGNWTTDLAGNQFIGVYEPTPIQGENQYYIYTSGQALNASAYAKQNGPLTINPLTGYIEFNAPTSNARILLEEADGSVTTISAVNADKFNAAEGWYSVDGVKLNSEPTQKGIYINNGKKVVIK